MSSTHTRLWSNENFLLSENQTHCYTHRQCSVGLHFHTFVELNVISNGIGLHRIHNMNVPVKKGDVFIIPKNTPHSYKNQGDLTVEHILISNEFFERNESQLNAIKNYNNLFKILSFLPSNNSPLFLDEENFKVFEYYWSILQATGLTKHQVQNRTDEQKIISNNLILSFLSFLCSTHKMPENVKQAETDMSAISKAIEYISLHYYEKLTNALLSNLCNLSESTFLRYFHKLLGTTPAVYIEQHRVAHSKILLTKSNKSITEIAQETGFFDSSHFNRTFKKITGISPLCYKKSKTTPNAI